MQNWPEIFRAPWSVSYPKVAEAAKVLLAGRTNPLTLGALADLLLPLANVVTDADLRAKIKIRAALLALTRHELASYARRGPPKRVPIATNGHRILKVVHPWVFADFGLPNTEAVKTCPACGGKLKPTGENHESVSD